MDEFLKKGGIEGEEKIKIGGGTYRIVFLMGEVVFAPTVRLTLFLCSEMGFHLLNPEIIAVSRLAPPLGSERNFHRSSHLRVESGGVTGTKGGFAISGYLTDTKLLFYLDVRSCIYVPPALSRPVHVASMVATQRIHGSTRRNVVATVRQSRL